MAPIVRFEENTILKIEEGQSCILKVPVRAGANGELIITLDCRADDYKFDTPDGKKNKQEFIVQADNWIKYIDHELEFTFFRKRGEETTYKTKIFVTAKNAKGEECTDENVSVDVDYTVPATGMIT